MVPKVSCGWRVTGRSSILELWPGKPLFLNLRLTSRVHTMSLGRTFLINELRRLELRFHPDSPGDEKAIEYIRAAIQSLAPKPVRPQRLIESGLPTHLRTKAY